MEIGLRLDGLSGSVAISLQGRCQGDTGSGSSHMRVERTPRAFAKSAVNQPGDHR